MDRVFDARVRLLLSECRDDKIMVVLGPEGVGKTRLLHEIARRVGGKYACCVDDDIEECKESNILDEFGYLWQLNPGEAHSFLRREAPVVIGVHPWFWYKYQDEMIPAASLRPFVHYVTPYGRRSSLRLAESLLPIQLRSDAEYVQQIAVAARGYPRWMTKLAQRSSARKEEPAELQHTLAAYAQAQTDVGRMLSATSALQEWIREVAVRPPWTSGPCPAALFSEARLGGWCAPDGTEIVSPPLCAWLSLNS